ESMAAGMMAAGVEVLDLETTVTPVARFMTGNLQVAGGVHIKRTSERGEAVRINFFNSQGGNISKADERKIENLLAREDIRRMEPDKIREALLIPRAGEQYLSFLFSQIDGEAAPMRPLHVITNALPASLAALAPPLLERLGCLVEYVFMPEPAECPPAGLGSRFSLLAGAVVDRGADLGFYLGPSGEQLVLIDDQGRLIAEDRLLALISLLILRTMPEGKLVIPVTASSVIDKLAARHRGQVIRTKTALQSLMDYCLQGGLEGDSYQQFLMNFDALYALGRILSYLGGQGLKLSQLLEEIPDFHLIKEAVECPWEAKGKVIRSLIEEHKNDRVELLDGIKVFYDKGWTLVLPDSEEPLCRVYSEGYSMEIAQELSAQLIEKINHILTPAGSSRE
ncbi:MAG TPA: nucleotidyltransferase, partial [Bacillota bacterium]|nr:nucleotidyltransferase [Bacillota bacterium]